MTDKAISPLRQRMIEDMTIRKFAPKTQHDYLQRVKNFSAYLGRSSDTASSEDVRRYQLHLTASGVGVPTVKRRSRRCGSSSRSHSGGPTSLSTRHSSTNPASFRWF
jgi:Phage integrase, N-terminal SAM-like domain